MSKYLSNFGQKRVVTFPIIKNICLVRIHRHRLTNTRRLIWESSDSLWTRKCSMWIRDPAQALLRWNRRPGRTLLLFHPTSSYMKDFFILFGLIFFFFFFVTSFQRWSLTFILHSAVHVTHSGPVSPSLNERAFILLEQERAVAVWFAGMWQIAGFLITISRCDPSHHRWPVPPSKALYFPLFMKQIPCC